MGPLKVSANSNPNSVEVVLADVIRKQGSVEIQTIWAGALKAVGSRNDDVQ